MGNNIVLVGIKPNVFKWSHLLLKSIINDLEMDGTIGVELSYKKVPSSLISHIYKGNKWHDNCVNNLSGRKMIFYAFETSLDFDELSKLKEYIRDTVPDDYCPSMNTIHISDSEDAAKRELEIFKHLL